MKYDTFKKLEGGRLSNTPSNAEPPEVATTITTHIHRDDRRIASLINAMRSMGALVFLTHEQAGLTLSVLEEDLGNLLLSIEKYTPGNGAFVINPANEHMPLAALVPLGVKNRHFTLAFPEKGAGGKEIKASALNVIVWRKTAHYSDVDTYESGKELFAMRRVRLGTLRKIADGEIDIAAVYSKITPTFDVDIVYTWVNDKDEAWQEERRTYSGVAAPENASEKSRSNLDERFQNRDELKYSLRSIEAYADFVRNIYIVTNGQVPDWLDTSNPKIRIVSHRELYPDTSVLPTFNSSSIETVLHRIEGLSEHFLYFNDDFILGSRVTRHDFFDMTGNPRCFPAGQYAFKEDIDDESEEYIIADKNAMILMEETTGYYSGRIMQHTPYPCRRSLLTELETAYAEAFAACRAQRFRSKSDLRPIAFILGNLGMITGSVVPSEMKHDYIALWRPNLDQRLERALTKRAAKTICINDAGIPDDRRDSVNRMVKEFLESYLPFKSQFEK